jgi:hypothetical protein
MVTHANNVDKPHLNKAKSLFLNVKSKRKIRKMNPDLISVPEAAAILGITVPSVHYRIKTRSILPVGTFAGSPVLSKKAIEALKSEIREKR